MPKSKKPSQEQRNMRVVMAGEGQRQRVPWLRIAEGARRCLS